MYTNVWDRFYNPLCKNILTKLQVLLRNEKTNVSDRACTYFRRLCTKQSFYLSTVDLHEMFNICNCTLFSAILQLSLSFLANILRSHPCPQTCVWNFTLNNFILTNPLIRCCALITPGTCSSMVNINLFTIQLTMQRFAWSCFCKVLLAWEVLQKYFFLLTTTVS